jgi:hypothetical protein
MNTENQKSSSKTPSSQGGVIGGFIKLKWTVLNSHSGKSWISTIPNLGVSYGIWIDRDTGKTIVSGLDRSRTNHESIELAKEWCQNDFEQKIKFLIHED